MSESAKIAVIVGGTNTKLVAFSNDDKRIYEEDFDTLTGEGKELMVKCQNVPDRKTFTLDHWDEFLSFRQEYIDKLAQKIKDVISNVDKKGLRATFVGISTPGAVHPITGEIVGKLGALNLPAWGNFNPAREIESKVWVSTKCINDAKAMALGTILNLYRDSTTFRPYKEDSIELDLGESAEKISSFIEIDPGTGLGGAFVVDKKIWFGRDKSNPDPKIGEIWHFIIDKKSPHKNFEELASGRATITRIQEAVLEKNNPKITEEFEKCGGKTQELLKSNSKELTELVLAEIERTGKWLSKGACFLKNIELKRLEGPSINTIIIGGGMVSGRTKEASLVRKVIYSSMMEEFSCLKENSSEISIVFSILGSDAGIYGTAHLAKYSFK